MYTDDDEIGRAVAADLEECWQGEGWYRVTGDDGEKWEPDFYVTRECLVAALRDAYDEASFSGAICVPRVEPAPAAACAERTPSEPPRDSNWARTEPEESLRVSHNRLPTGRMGSLRSSGHGKRRAPVPAQYIAAQTHIYALTHLSIWVHTWRRRRGDRPPRRNRKDRSQ